MKDFVVYRETDLDGDKVPSFVRIITAHNRIDAVKKYFGLFHIDKHGVGEKPAIENIHVAEVRERHAYRMAFHLKEEPVNGKTVGGYDE